MYEPSGSSSAVLMVIRDMLLWGSLDGFLLLNFTTGGFSRGSNESSVSLATALGRAAGLAAAGLAAAGLRLTGAGAGEGGAEGGASPRPAAPSPEG